MGWPLPGSCGLQPQTGQDWLTVEAWALSLNPHTSSYCPALRSAHVNNSQGLSVASTMKIVLFLVLFISHGEGK